MVPWRWSVRNGPHKGGTLRTLLFCHHGNTDGPDPTPTPGLFGLPPPSPGGGLNTQETAPPRSQSPPLPPAYSACPLPLPEGAQYHAISLRPYPNPHPYPRPIRPAPSHSRRGLILPSSPENTHSKPIITFAIPSIPSRVPTHPPRAPGRSTPERMGARGWSVRPLAAPRAAPGGSDYHANRQTLTQNQ